LFDFNNSIFKKPNTSLMKILVVEDNQLILKVIETKLKKEGHDVISCENGKEAIEKIKHSLPDLVITDIMLPYNSGLEIVSFVKVDLKKNIPVIVISGMGQERTIEEAFKLGADDYMTKPFSLSELSMRIKRFSRVFNAA
jgi:DNA-binding response OmpR family regulator